MARDLISDYLPENADLKRNQYHPGLITLKKFSFLIFRKNRD
jgi:hypothetical protein